MRQLYEYFQYDNLNRLTRAERNTTGGGTVVITAAYNAIGNITNKSDVGDYSYGVKPHAVTEVAGLVNATYTYDANGNLSAGNNRTVSWTDWNMPASISQGANTVNFVYDGDRDRLQQVTPSGTITYLRGQGLFLERTQKPDGSSEYRHYLNAGGRLIAIYTTRTDSQGNPGTSDTHYFHPDHLNSIAIVTDDAGSVIARYDFDPWGKRALVSGANVERRGFTGHEELEAVGLVHMNGRIYDPVLGRFLSADPHIDGTDLQAFNRYTYVSNNPLTFTDPTGYFKLFGKKWSDARDQVVKPIVAMVVAWYIGPAAFQAGFWGVGGAVATATGSGALGVVTGAIAGGALAGAITTATTSLISTGDINMSGWGQAALSSTLFFGAGEVGTADSIERYAAHAAAGCISSAAGGGKCGSGAASAVMGKYTTNMTKDWSPAAQFAATAVSGGTASALGGGKFGNGAMTAAFGYLYNCAMHEGCWTQPYNENRVVAGNVYSVRFHTHGTAECVARLCNADWNDPGTIEWARAVHAEGAATAGNAALIVFLRCPTCVSGKVAGGVGTAAGVTEAYLKRDATPVVGMSVGAKVTDYAIKAGLSANSAGRLGAIVDKAIGYFHEN